jgi:CHAT domain
MMKRARHQGRLDLILTSMIPWIAEKPWEFAYDHGRESFLATEEIHFIRNVMTNVPADPIVRSEGPLSILVASAQPVGFGRLSIDQEVAVIRRGFEPLVEAGLVEIESLARATPSQIHGYLQTGSYQIVHFIGHGVYDEDRGEGCLIYGAWAGNIGVRHASLDA